GERGRRHEHTHGLLARAAIPARLFANVCQKITLQRPATGPAPGREARTDKFDPRQSQRFALLRHSRRAFPSLLAKTKINVDVNGIRRYNENINFRYIRKA
ncbi:MAG TPA: hypothetical protein PKE04_21525, partial [Clostridia bacterium]|nr:hypothetical protein [Clostridia bacterium]